MNPKILIKILFSALAVPAFLSAAPRVALVGPYADTDGGVDAEVARIAVASAASDTEHGIGELELAVYADGGSATSAAETAREIVGNKDVKAVVLRGENSAAAEVLDIYARAGLAVVAADSWIADRGENPSGTTWLSPTQLELARVAAHYARRGGRKLKQVAVLDNASPTSVAAADMFEKRFKELGGKVVFRGEWQGSHWGMTRTARALKLNWPQAVFVPLEPEASGRLVKEMKRRDMGAAFLIGEPRLFEEAFFQNGRMATQGSVGILPYPDYRGRAMLSKLVGHSWSKNTAHWKAYMYAYKNPRRKTSMVFDATYLLIRAMRNAAGDQDMEEEPESDAPDDIIEGDGDSPDEGGTAAGLTLTAQASPTAEAKVRRWKAERRAVRDALSKITSYRGIRGTVTIDENRQPKRVRGMVLQALPKVNSKWMRWWPFKFGPPW